MLRDLPEVRDELYQWATSDVVRVPMGYRFFDDRTQGGMAPGQAMILLARTGVGKTWWLINVAVNNPNVVAACGCGSSFQVREDAAEQAAAV